MIANQKALFVILLAVSLVIISLIGKQDFRNILPMPNVQFSDFVIGNSTASGKPFIKKMTFHLEEGLDLHLLDFEQMQGYNNMRVLNNECTSSDVENNRKDINSDKKFIVITNFAYMDPEDAKNHISVPKGGGLSFNENNIYARNMEIINVLAANLNHSFIQEIHILVKEPKTAEYLRRLPLANSHRAVIQVMKTSIEMNTQIRYAGKCLHDKIVAICHQDNLFGEGWWKLQPDILKKKRILYALTRHSSATNQCRGSKLSANCDPGQRYIGSHDVFMFHVKEQFAPQLLEPLDTVTPNLSGMENLLIWVFKVKLNYVVVNPCPQLIVYHQHCIAMRRPGRRRVNGGGRSGWVDFSHKFE